MLKDKEGGANLTGNESTSLHGVHPAMGTNKLGIQQYITKISSS